MNKVWISFLLIVTILSFLISVSPEEFCNAFERNVFNISYGFQRLLRPGNLETRVYDSGLNYLFIDRQYWKLRYIDNTDENQRAVEFENIESKVSNWFGSYYSLPFCAFKSFDNLECIPYLLSKTDQKWFYSELLTDKDVLDLQNTANQRSKPAQPAELHWQLSYMSAPVLRTIHPRNNTVYAMDDVIVFYSQPQQQFKIYTVGLSSTTLLADNLSFMHKGNISNKGTHVYEEDVLKNLPQKPDIVAIFTQFKDKFENISFQAFQGSQMIVTGVIIVFREETALKYCWTSATQLSDRCKPPNLKVLINCTKKDTDQASNMTNTTNTISEHINTTSGDFEVTNPLVSEQPSNFSSNNTETISTITTTQSSIDSNETKTPGYCNGDNGSIFSSQTKLFQYLIQYFLLIVINIYILN